MGSLEELPRVPWWPRRKLWAAGESRGSVLSIFRAWGGLGFPPQIPPGGEKGGTPVGAVGRILPSVGNAVRERIARKKPVIIYHGHRFEMR